MVYQAIVSGNLAAIMYTKHKVALFVIYIDASTMTGKWIIALQKIIDSYYSRSDRSPNDIELRAYISKRSRICYDGNPDLYDP